MMLYLAKLFLCFIIFSFFGWCIEVVFGRITTKKFVNRGFLIGPLCPIYGTGGILLYLLLRQYADDPIILAVMAMVVCSIVEYIASYLMEKIFKARWWDYTDFKFNINGRICLEMAIAFSLLGLLVIYVLFPFVLGLLDKMSPLAIYIIAGIILLTFIIDILVSFKIIMKFTETALAVPKDMTEEITKFVKKTLSKNKMTKRLVDSFPDLHIDFDSIKKKILKTIKK